MATCFALCWMSACTEAELRTEQRMEPPPVQKPTTLADKIVSELSGILPWVLAQQQQDGAFIDIDHLAIKVTALAIDALAAPPQALATDDPRLQRAVAFLLGKQQADGCFHVSGGVDFAGRDTALALHALSRAKAGSPDQITRAQEYLFNSQHAKPNSPWEGGIGAGDPALGATDDYQYENLESTSLAIQALRASGVPASDPHLQLALGFVSRCQDLASEHNRLPWVTGTGRGMFSPPQGDGESPLATEPTTYDDLTWTCLLISNYVLLDVPPEDPRRIQAMAWLRTNTPVKNGHICDPPAISPDNLYRPDVFSYYSTMGGMCELLDRGIQATTHTLADNGPDVPRFIRCAQLWNTLIDASFLGTFPNGAAMFVWLNSDSAHDERYPQVATVQALKTLKSIYRPSWPK